MEEEEIKRYIKKKNTESVWVRNKAEGEDIRH